MIRVSAPLAPSVAAAVVALPVPLVTATERARLVENGLASLADPDGFDPEPVVRLVSRALGVNWLLTELDPCRSSGIAFGLVDEGEGCADLACIDLTELVRDGVFQRDPRFQAAGPLSLYLATARRPTHARPLDREVWHAS